MPTWFRTFRFHVTASNFSPLHFGQGFWLEVKSQNPTPLHRLPVISEAFVRAGSGLHDVVKVDPGLDVGAIGRPLLRIRYGCSCVFENANPAGPPASKRRPLKTVSELYFPNTFFTSPTFACTLPATFSVVPRSVRSGLPTAFPASSLIFPLASWIRPLTLPFYLSSYI